METPFFVAVHVGAGFHSERKSRDYSQAMRNACKRAAAILQQDGSAEEATVEAIKSLEVFSLSYPCCTPQSRILHAWRFVALV